MTRKGRWTTGASTYRVRLMDIDVAGWDRVIAVNLTGTMLGTRTLVPLMPRNRRNVGPSRYDVRM